MLIHEVINNKWSASGILMCNSSIKSETVRKHTKLWHLCIANELYTHNIHIESNMAGAYQPNLIESDLFLGVLPEAAVILWTVKCFRFVFNVLDHFIWYSGIHSIKKNVITKYIKEKREHIYTFMLKKCIIML